MAKSNILEYRIFVGERPIEELSNQEREEFSERVVERMGRALNDYFSCHPEEYIRWIKSTEESKESTNNGTQKSVQADQGRGAGRR